MPLKISFDPRERRRKALGKLMLKPPRLDDTFGSPNAVRTSKISEKSIVMHIIHQFISLFMFSKNLKLIMRHNSCMVTFMEIAYGEIALLA